MIRAVENLGSVLRFKISRWHRVPLLMLIGSLLSGCSLQLAKTALSGDNRELRDRRSPEQSPAPYPDLLVLAVDGVDRSLIYDLLRRGEMPELAALLGKPPATAAGEFPTTYFGETLHTVLPSSTAIAWASAFTGEKPASHGVVGNEYFIRETGEFAAPVAVTVDGGDTMLGTYNDGYFNKLLSAPTVYQKMRERDPGILIWVALQQVFAGADRLLITDRSIFYTGFKAWITKFARENLSDEQSHALVAEIDNETFDEVIESLDENGVPDVLTVYVAGTDKIAHVAENGPNDSRREYMKDSLDTQFGLLRKALEKHNALEDRYVVLVSDHGHTEVMSDDTHSLAKNFEDDPPALIQAGGFKLRPFEQKLPEDEPFDTVLAYQGAMAYLYVADRSTCPAQDSACDWRKPARFQQDVVPLAELFYRNNRDGRTVPELQGTLDIIFTRKPAAFYEPAQPFEVYVGNGKTMPIDDWLAKNPRPDYVDLARRMNDLAVGRHGHRAGDIILLANNGNGVGVKDRYYFASLYRSWHGSPSRRDAEIPLIVGHPKRSRAETKAIVDAALGNSPTLEKLTDLLMALRFDSGQSAHQ